MRKQRKIVVKYAGFNLLTREFYLCSSKKDIAKVVGSSVDTIRRRSLISNTFTINNWAIEVDVEIYKQPIRNTSSKLFS